MDKKTIGGIISFLVAIVLINVILDPNIFPNIKIFLGTIDKPKSRIVVFYYSPQWMPDNKRIAYIKSIEYRKFIYAWWFTEVSLARTDTEKTDYQICSLDSETNEEKIIQTIKVYPKSDHFGHRYWYEWNDKKYKGIKEVRSLDVNPLSGQMLVSTLGTEQYHKLNTNSGPVFLLDENRKGFKNIIDDGLNAHWSEDGKKIIYETDKVEIKTHGEGIDRVHDEIHHQSLLIKDLIKNEDRKLLDWVPRPWSLSPNNKEIIYYRDDKPSDKYPSRMIDVAYIKDIDTLKVTEILYARDIVWSSDNATIAYNLVLPVEEKDRRYDYLVGTGRFENNKFIQDYEIKSASSPMWNFDGTAILYHSHTDNSTYSFDIASQRIEKVNLPGYPVKWINPERLLCVDNTKGFLLIDFKNKKIVSKNNIFSDNPDKYFEPYSIISYTHDGNKMLGKKDGLFVMNLNNLGYKIFTKNYEKEFK